MKRIVVDAERRLAHAEPGLLLREYDAATQAHGLASPGGEILHTGLTDEGEDRTHEAYGARTWERLVRAKRRYDSTNLFRMNQNIRPH